MNREITVLRNVRRIQTKVWNRKHCNWSVISQIFGYGAGSSCDKCKELNIDPDGYEIEEIK